MSEYEWVESFDTYNGLGANTGLASRWISAMAGAGVAQSLAPGRFGGQCARVTVSSNSAQTNTISRFRTPAATLSDGFAFRKSALGDTVHFMWLLSGGSYQVGLTVNPDGSLTAGRYTAIGSATSLGSSGPGKIAPNVWHYIEYEITISDTAGIFNVYVDDKPAISLTLQDTRNGAPTTVDTVQLGAFRSSTGSAANLDFDDLYVRNAAARLGERMVETVYGLLDTAQKDWTPSSGTSNVAMVNEPQVNVANYVEASTVGATDRYRFAALSSTPSKIDAVQIIAYGQKTDAAARAVALQVKSGATVADGPSFALGASVQKFERLMTTDPNTSAAWTAAAVNAIEAGPKVTV